MPYIPDGHPLWAAPDFLAIAMAEKGRVAGEVERARRLVRKSEELRLRAYAASLDAAATAVGAKSLKPAPPPPAGLPPSPR